MHVRSQASSINGHSCDEVRMTGCRTGVEMTEVVWGQTGESQGSLWELAAFEAGLRMSGKSPSNEVFWTGEWVPQELLPPKNQLSKDS